MVFRLSGILLLTLLFSLPLRAEEARPVRDPAVSQDFIHALGDADVSAEEAGNIIDFLKNPDAPKAPAAPAAPEVNKAARPPAAPIEEDQYFSIPSTPPATQPVPAAETKRPAPAPVAQPKPRPKTVVTKAAPPAAPRRPVGQTPPTRPGEGSAIADLLKENPMPHVKPETKPEPENAAKTVPVGKSLNVRKPVPPTTPGSALATERAAGTIKPVNPSATIQPASPPASQEEPKPLVPPPARTGEPRLLGVTNSPGTQVKEATAAPKALVPPPTPGVPVPQMKPGSSQTLSTAANPTQPKVLILPDAANKPNDPYLYAPSVIQQPDAPIRPLQDDPNILRAAPEDTLPSAAPDIVDADKALEEATRTKQPLASRRKPGTTATELEPIPAAEGETAPIEGDMFDKKYVTRAVFSKQIYNRTPAEVITRISRFEPGVNYYTSLRNLQGHTVRHVWELNGRVISVHEMKIHGYTWRTWSWLTFKPEYKGTMIGKVVDAAGNVLARQTLMVE